METNDNTLLEMQQQMQQLRDKLENQRIVNERLLQRSCGQSIGRLKLKSRVPIIAGFAALLCSGSFFNLGASLPFLIFTWVMVLVAIAATILSNRHIPRMDCDLVTAGEELVKFKRIHTEWIKYSLPVLAVWVGWLIYELIIGPKTADREILYPLICGVIVGLALGLILGLKNRREVLDGTDELLAQIKELRKGE